MTYIFGFAFFGLVGVAVYSLCKASAEVSRHEEEMWWREAEVDAEIYVAMHENNFAELERWMRMPDMRGAAK